MNNRSTSALAQRLKRVGYILFAVASFWWFFGQQVIVSVAKLDRMSAGFWVVLSTGTLVLAGVVVYCLGRYTFD